MHDTADIGRAALRFEQEGPCTSDTHGRLVILGTIAMADVALNTPSRCYNVCVLGSYEPRLSGCARFTDYHSEKRNRRT